MLKNQPIEAENAGVCCLLSNYCFRQARPRMSWGHTPSEVWLTIQGVYRSAVYAWVESTAVPSSSSAVYPVAHPELDPHVAYTKGAEGFIKMWKGEYGDNRKQFLEFVSDYLEEAWK